MIIRIKDLRLRTIIGINDWERENKQDVVINVKIEFDGSKAAETDSIDETVNYKAITKRIIKEVEGSDFYLLEALSNHVLQIVMEDRRVKKATVEVDKPHALRFSDSVSVQSSAERGREA
ncbi:MAG: dihydroneopterin triphosphate 2'-epimerase [Candidatus Bipolaricaulia bacterium]